MDDDMNSRLTILETKLETILPTLATKGDLSDMKAGISDMKAAIVMWVSLVTLSAAALNIAVMVFMLNRLPQQPQVIIVPQQPAPPAK